MSCCGCLGGWRVTRVRGSDLAVSDLCKSGNLGWILYIVASWYMIYVYIWSHIMYVHFTCKDQMNMHSCSCQTSWYMIRYMHISDHIYMHVRMYMKRSAENFITYHLTYKSGHLCSDQQIIWSEITFSKKSWLSDQISADQQCLNPVYERCHQIVLVPFLKKKQQKYKLIRLISSVGRLIDSSIYDQLID